MPMTSRPWSINTFCLSKLWYRTAILDLRVGDSSTITSYVKGWLYQDTLIKPQELIMYRDTSIGGLGVQNVKLRSMAMLIHTFISQAISPKFTTNMYHFTLYRWHVRRGTFPTLAVHHTTPILSSISSKIFIRIHP